MYLIFFFLFLPLQDEFSFFYRWKVYSNDANALRLVYAAYGDHLSGIGGSEAAGYAYLSGGLPAKALSSFKECSKWREAIHAARITGADADALRGLAYLSHPTRSPFRNSLLFFY